MLDFLDCFSTLSPWKAIHQEVVSAALVCDQSMSTVKILESEFHYLTGQAYNMRWYQLLPYIMKVLTPVR